MAGSGTAHMRPAEDVLLRVEDLVVEFPQGRGRVVHAVSGISFHIAAGETLGLVGESGCGKSTTGRAVLQLPPPTSGSVTLDGEDLTGVGSSTMRERRTKLQMIFQDPISSLNPRRTIGEVVAEPLGVWGPKKKDAQWETVARVLDDVGIDPGVARYKRPHEFSGGQCQRISIARALVMEPELIICDEPVSALDVSIQAQILNLLEDLKKEHGLTLVFIAHDLAVVKNISDRVAVMYLGKCARSPKPTSCTPTRRIRTPRCCSSRARSPTPESTSRMSTCWRATSPRRWRLRRGAASALVAPGPPTCARPTSRRCGGYRKNTTSPAIIRSSSRPRQWSAWGSGSEPAKGIATVE